MDDLTLQSVTGEVAAVLQGGTWSRIWQLGRASFVCEIRNDGAPFLFLAAEPQQPRLYLVNRKVRDLERQMRTPQGIALTLRRQLSEAKLVEVIKDPDDRIVRFRFKGCDDLGANFERTLIAQLTGRAANLLLLDENGFVRDALRPLSGAGQEIGMRYAPPLAVAPGKPRPPLFTKEGHETLSAAADNYYTQLETERAFAARVAEARQKLNKEIAHREKQLSRLARELSAHGDPSHHKLLGDLLLANLTTAEREGSVVYLLDYFAPDAPRTALSIDENLTLQEAAQKSFALYAKAKRAVGEVALRSAKLEAELSGLRFRLSDLNESLAAGEETELSTPTTTKTGKPAPQKKTEAAKYSRQYLSTDGLEILVGRAAKDNDYLTFRLAKPHEWWLHAADYPGSHVIVRNPGRGDIPPRTLIEAAQLAAQYSQAKSQGKADVRYTQRKFLSKPKGAAPGLVRLSQFKTIVVTPAESGKRV